MKTKNKFSYEQKLKIRNEILKLTKNDWESLCVSILLPNKESITISKTGVYFSLNNISDKSLNAILHYINYQNNVLVFD